MMNKYYNRSLRQLREILHNNPNDQEAKEQIKTITESILKMNSTYLDQVGKYVRYAQVVLWICIIALIITFIWGMNQ